MLPALNPMQPRIARATSALNSPAVNQHVKCSLDRRTLRMRPIRRRRRRGSKIRRIQKQIVGLGVEPHRLGSVFRLDGFRFAELVWRVFVEYMNHALARGNK